MIHKPYIEAGRGGLGGGARSFALSHSHTRTYGLEIGRTPANPAREICKLHVEQKIQYALVQNERESKNSTG